MSISLRIDVHVGIVNMPIFCNVPNYTKSRVQD